MITAKTDSSHLDRMTAHYRRARAYTGHRMGVVWVRR